MGRERTKLKLEAKSEVEGASHIAKREVGVRDLGAYVLHRCQTNFALSPSPISSPVGMLRFWDFAADRV